MIKRGLACPRSELMKGLSIDLAAHPPQHQQVLVVTIAQAQCQCREGRQLCNDREILENSLKAKDLWGRIKYWQLGKNAEKKDWKGHMNNDVNKM